MTVPVGGVAAEPTTAPKAKPRDEEGRRAEARDGRCAGACRDGRPFRCDDGTGGTFSCPSAAPAPAADSAATVSIDTLKQKLTEVLKAKSAGVAQKAILDATGGAQRRSRACPSLYAAVYAKLDEALKG